MTQTQTAAEEDLLVSLTFHSFPAETLKEFSQKIVNPCFQGNMNEAVRNLMQKAINDETVFNEALIQNQP